MGLLDSLGFGRKDAADAARPPSAPAAGAIPAAPSWAPRIDAGACRTCGSCLDECPAGVFAMGRHDRSARVARPEDCLAGCDRCATHCPEKGITFPGR